MEVVVGNSDFLTIVTKSASGENKYPLKAPTFRQIRDYSKKSDGDDMGALENLLLELGLPNEVIDTLSIIDVNSISEQMVNLITKKK